VYSYAKKFPANYSVFRQHAEKLVCSVGWILALAKLGQDFKLTRSFGFP
jgi:hypothetical protein